MAHYLEENGLTYLWSKIKTLVGGKVDKVDGKGLSTNDYTTTEKNKLAGIAAGANAYTLPTASATVKGGIKVGSNLSMSGDVLNATDTTYSVATTSANGLMSKDDKTKLNDILNTVEFNPEDKEISITYNGIQVKISPTTISLMNLTNGIQTNIGSTGIAVIEGEDTATFDADWGASKVQGHTVLSDVPENAVFTDTTYSVATTSANGLMSKDDKTKLNGLSNYTLPTASASTKGGVKVGAGLSISSGVLAADVTTAILNAAKNEVLGLANNYTDGKVSGLYTYKGSVAAAANLPTSGQKSGDVYDIVAESTYGPAGTNVAWTGSAWDALGGSFSITALTNSEIDNICK